MQNKGNAFAKGASGCFIAFLVLALITLVLGGSVNIDFGGAMMLLIIGGIIGLIVNWIYQKGRQDAETEDNDEI